MAVVAALGLENCLGLAAHQGRNSFASKVPAAMDRRTCHPDAVADGYEGNHGLAVAHLAKESSAPSGGLGQKRLLALAQGDMHGRPYRIGLRPQIAIDRYA